MEKTQIVILGLVAIIAIIAIIVGGLLFKAWIKSEISDVEIGMYMYAGNFKECTNRDYSSQGRKWKLTTILADESIWYCYED